MKQQNPIIYEQETNENDALIIDNELLMSSRWETEIVMCARRKSTGIAVSETISILAEP